MKNKKQIIKTLEKKAYLHFRNKPQFLKLEALIRKSGGIMVYVGGVIRSIATDQNIQDYDAEVYMLSMPQLKEILEEYAASIKSALVFVGAQFGVFKLSTLNLDIAIPRIERSTGLKHRDFDIICDPYMNYTNASLRRDFKMNSIGYARYFRTILDPNNGIADIVNKHISIVKSEEVFLEDPLRLLRAIYFSNKLSFKLDDNIVSMLSEQSHLLVNISIERIAHEFYKTMNSKHIEYLHYFALLKDHKIKFLDIFQTIISNPVAEKMLKNLDTIQSRIFFLLIHHFDTHVIDFLKKMPNHREYYLLELITLATIYNATYICKDEYAAKATLRKLQQETFYVNLKSILLQLDKYTYLHNYTYKITKLIVTYVVTYKGYKNQQTRRRFANT